MSAESMYPGVTVHPASFMFMMVDLALSVDHSEIERQEQLDRERKIHEMNLAKGAKKAIANTNSYTAATVAALKGVRLCSSDIGRVTGCNRTTAFKRLIVLKEKGLVVRIGRGVATQWELA